MPTANDAGGRTAPQTPPVVSAQAWEEARQNLLVKEKAQPVRVTRWPPSAGACHGWPSRKPTHSRGRRAG